MAWRSLAVGCSLLLMAVLAPAAPAAIVHLPQGALELPASLGERAVSGVTADAAGNVYVGARGSQDSSVVVFDREGGWTRRDRPGRRQVRSPGAGTADPGPP